MSGPSTGYSLKELLTELKIDLQKSQVAPESRLEKSQVAVLSDTQTSQAAVLSDTQTSQAALESRLEKK